MFAGAGIGGCLYRRDARTGEPDGTPGECHNGYIMTRTSLVLPDGTPLPATGGEDGTVRRWHAESGEPEGDRVGSIARTTSESTAA